MELTVDSVRDHYLKMISEDPGKTKKFMDMLEIKKLRNERFLGSAYPDWEGFPIEEKTYHGWLLSMLLPIEGAINGRWPYWLDILETMEIENKPIPQIKIYTPGKPEFKFVSEMIKKCLDVENGLGLKNFYLFIDWLLYGLGSPIIKEFPADIDNELNEFWYKTFKGDLMIMFPGDYFVPIASELYSSKTFNANGFYPTPGQIIQLMTDIIFSTDTPENREANKYKTVNDPTAGSGSMLLYASNYSLRLSGQDKDELMYKLCHINGYFYMPWLVNTNNKINKLLEEMGKKYNANERSA